MQKIHKEQQKEVTFYVNKENKPEDPSKREKCSEKDSFLKLSDKLQYFTSEQPNNLLNFQGENGLVAAASLSFYEHYNLELSPDDIWLAILQGFSNHMEMNSEKLRKQFVEFEGKKSLIIEREEQKDSTKLQSFWEGCFSEWNGQIEKNIGQNNYKNLVPNFSTTGKIASSCFNATIMDSMKDYFEYIVLYGCGIPQVKLTGSLEDWQELRQKTQNLGQYDLEWWTSILLPILDKFIESYQGKVDEMFWNCIYKQVPRIFSYENYYPETTTGWVLNFFPYIWSNEEKQKIKSYCLRPLEEIYKNYKDLEEQAKIGVENCMEKNMEMVHGIMNEHDKPLGGITETPFKFKNLKTGQTTDMYILAGFHNVCYENGFIKPAKGWAISQEPKKQYSEEDEYY